MASRYHKPASLASQRIKEKVKIEVKLTEEQTKDMKEAFDLFDPDETGTIDVNGIMVAVRALGLQVEKDEIQKMIPVSGKIDFGDFLRVMTQEMGKTDSEEKMTMAFHLFDDDCTGTISFENLKRVAEELGENLTDEELQEMIVFADKDGDGEVNKKEFLRMMRKTKMNKSHNV